MTTLVPCPECAAGKCKNCDGRTWDDEQDDYATCPCAERNHGEAPMSPEEFESIIAKGMRAQQAMDALGVGSQGWPRGPGWKHQYNHRCPSMDKHHPDEGPSLPIPCDDCFVIETYTRPRPYSTTELPQEASQ